MTGITGHTYRFPLVGRGVATVNRARSSDLQPMNLTDTTAIATMQTVIAPEYIDSMDEVQTNLDIRTAYTESCVGAVSRQLDSIIIAAAQAGATDFTSSLTTANTLDGNGLTDMGQVLSQQFVPHGDRFAVISPGAMKTILQDSRVVNDLYVNKGAVERGYAEGVLGFSLIESLLLPNVLTGTAPNQTYNTGATGQNMFWHKTALGCAMAMDLELEVAWISQKDSWLVKAKLVAGAVTIDPLGVISAQINN